MSDSYSIGCNDCKKALCIGQAAGDRPFCFYSGEPETMKQLKDFLYAHFRHALIFQLSDILDDEYSNEDEPPEVTP